MAQVQGSGPTAIGSLAYGITDRVYYFGKTAQKIVETVYHVALATFYSAATVVSSTQSLEDRRIEMWAQSSADFTDFRDYGVAILSGEDPAGSPVPKQIAPKKQAKQADEAPAAQPAQPAAPAQPAVVDTAVENLLDMTGKATLSLGQSAVEGVKSWWSDVAEKKEKEAALKVVEADIEKEVATYKKYLERYTDNPANAIDAATKKGMLDQWDAELPVVRSALKDEAKEYTARQLKGANIKYTIRMSAQDKLAKLANRCSEMAAGVVEGPVGAAGAVARAASAVWDYTGGKVVDAVTAPFVGLNDYTVVQFFTGLKLTKLIGWTAVAALTMNFIPFTPFAYFSWKGYLWTAAGIGATFTYKPVISTVWNTAVAGVQKAKLDKWLVATALLVGAGAMSPVWLPTDELNWTSYLGVCTGLGGFIVYLGFKETFMFPVSLTKWAFKKLRT